MVYIVHKRKRRADLGEPKPPLERAEQRTIAKFLDGLRIVWFHPPNGGDRGNHAFRKGGRTSITAAIMKAEGVKRGVPDVMIFDRPRRWLPGICVCHNPAQAMILDGTQNNGCWMHGSFSARPHLLYETQDLTKAALEKLGMDRPIGVGLELKRLGATASAIKPEQFAWMQDLARRGWYCFVSRGVIEAQNELEKLGYWRGA